MSIDEVIAKFNFKNVRAYMEHHNWHWYGEDMPPTLAALKKTAKDLMLEAFSNETGYCASGGFVAERMALGVSLSFVHTIEEVQPELE